MSGFRIPRFRIRQKEDEQTQLIQTPRDTVDITPTNVVLALVAIIAVVALILILLFQHNLNTRIQTNQVQMTQKCVEVLELQTLTNQTGNGVLVVAAPQTFGTSSFVCLSGCLLEWGTERWDDADFFDVATDPTAISIPQDGRYAIAVNCQVRCAFILADVGEECGPGNFIIRTDLCKGGTSCDPGFSESLPLQCNTGQDSFRAPSSMDDGHSLVGYCELELRKETNNYLQFQFQQLNVAPGPTNFEIGFTPQDFGECIVTVRQIGGLGGSGIGFV